MKKKAIVIPVYGKEKPYQGKEEDFQKATALLVAHYPFLEKLAFHVPNERGAGRKEESNFRRVMAIQRKKLSAQGVKTGISDWIFLVPRGTFHGMVLELKTKKNKTTDSQDEFLEAAAAEGYFAAVIYNLDTFHAVLEWYLNL